jgi:hypothetical protein
LLRRGWLSPANACAWSAIAVLMQVNGGLDRLPSEVSVLAGICLMTGGALLLPWGVAGQTVLVATSLIAGTLAILLHPTTAAPVPYLLFALAAGGAISLFGAYHFELHRFALFVEATRREEEASIGQSLVAIAKEINDALDADDVLDRIAGVIRSALHASWTVIVLCDASRDACAVVGSAGRAPDGITGLRGIEFGSGALPLVDQVLTERHISLTDQDADPATAGVMRRCCGAAPSWASCSPGRTGCRPASPIAVARSRVASPSTSRSRSTTCAWSPTCAAPTPSSRTSCR